MRLQAVPLPEFAAARRRRSLRRLPRRARSPATASGSPTWCGTRTRPAVHPDRLLRRQRGARSPARRPHRRRYAERRPRAAADHVRRSAGGVPLLGPGEPRGQPPLRPARHRRRHHAIRRSLGAGRRRPQRVRRPHARGARREDDPRPPRRAGRDRGDRAAPRLRRGFAAAAPLGHQRLGHGRGRGRGRARRRARSNTTSATTSTS